MAESASIMELLAMLVDACKGYDEAIQAAEKPHLRLSHNRLYREERLTVRRRGGRKRALGTRAPMAIPLDRSLRWSLDFVADTLMSGRRFRILTLVDDFTRECLDLFGFNANILADAAAHGFTNTTDPCYAFTGLPTSTASNTGCNTGNIDSFVYWNDIHPTARCRPCGPKGSERRFPSPRPGRCCSSAS